MTYLCWRDANQPDYQKKHGLLSMHCIDPRTKTSNTWNWSDFVHHIESAVFFLKKAQNISIQSLCLVSNLFL